MRGSWVLPTAVALLGAMFLVLGASTVVLGVTAVQSHRDRVALEAEVAELRDEVEQLRAQLADAPPDDPGGLLDGLPDIGDLLDGLLGDGGGLLDGLTDDDPSGDAAFDPSATHGAACLTPEPGGGGLGGIFGDLFPDDEPAPDDVDQLVDRVADQVAELRELTWVEQVEVDLLDDEATRARIEELTQPEEDERAALEGRRVLLSAIGALPDDVDLVQLQRDVLGDAVAGFYVADTGETVVRIPDDGGLPAPADQVALAHELGHALVDQVLGLPARDEPPLVDDLDANLAALALVEGDASLLMNLWALEHLSLMEMLSMAVGPGAAEQQEMFDGLPDVLVRELLFPYTLALDWACDVYLDGGWSAIDAAYDDLPTTTAEILFGTPVTPVEPATPAPPSGDAEEVFTSTFGAVELLWQLQAPGGDPAASLSDPHRRVQTWAGGSAQAWVDGGDEVAAVSLAFTRDDEITGCDTMTAWADAAFPGAGTEIQGGRTVLDTGGRVVAVDCIPGSGAGSTDQVRIVVAPNVDTAERMLS